MPEVIKLRKGLDIKLKGAADKELVAVKASKQYALVPDDFIGVTPKVVVAEGQHVKAGEALFVDKKHPEVKFVSPVSGVVAAVNRGARRKVMSIVVTADAKQESVNFGVKSVHSLSGDRMDPNVPLIVPEVNPEDVAWHNGIISNPNCSTIITLTAVNALNSISPIRTMTASTYQAVSGAGAEGPVELQNEVDALAKGETYQPKVFSHQIAFNLIPQIGGEAYEGYTSEEMKMQNEGRKIMHLPELAVSCTCVRVPVMRSHSISVSCHFDVPVTVEQVRNVIANAPGCKLVDDLANKQYPMPLDTSDQDLVFVGRIRPDLTDDNGICLWCCGDQVRKGAATNCIQIAELLVK